MPATLTYLLLYPTLPGVVTGGTAFPGDSSRLVCDAEMFDQAHFLALIDRLLPVEYVYPLKTTVDGGYEIFQAIAKVAEELSEAAHEAECGLTILYSGGGIKATGAVTFYRENITAGAVTVKANTLLFTSKNGRRFVTTADAVFSGSDLAKTAPVEAIAPGYAYNVRGQGTTAAVETLPGEIDSIDVMLQDPPHGDRTIKVRQHADCAGGYPAWLDGHGETRGTIRAAGETDDAYRLRVRSLPDVVTPAAIRRMLTRVLTPTGISWQLIETWQISYMTAWDAPSPNVGTPTYQTSPIVNPLYNHALFTYDDPRGPTSYPNRWLGSDDYLGAFIVVIGSETVLDYGMVLDDPGTSAEQFARRGTPAYDIASYSAAIHVGALDGEDAGRSAAIAALLAKLSVKKPAAITAIVDNYHTW